MSHGATARHALEHGDPVLAQICGAIAADEGRHEIAYSRIVDELWRLCAPNPTHSLVDHRIYLMCPLPVIMQPCQSRSLKPLCPRP